MVRGAGGCFNLSIIRGEGGGGHFASHTFFCTSYAASKCIAFSLSESDELRRIREWFGIIHAKFMFVMNWLILSASAIEWVPLGPMSLAVKYCI